MSRLPRSGIHFRLRSTLASHRYFAVRPSAEMHPESCFLPMACGRRYISRERPGKRTVLEKTPSDTPEIPVRSDRNRAAIPVRAARTDGRSWGARRTKQLTGEWVHRLGGPDAVDTVTLGRVKRAAELCAIAERARADALQGGGDGLDNLVRVERLADLAVRQLGLDCKPPEPERLVTTIGAGETRCRTGDAREYLMQKLDAMAKRGG